ncbi:uncharacterized protein LOC126783819 isoform X2 [Argentina anserina]|uniref:uncharacterized protein LOC126783819 isoform X2 n=1 Tax=Argentina anserina TaxID=57926 RepID=UPI0021767E29|nr:uncharacterized protein LOC126783819 isoform X2 [Potentilla anserina]
MAYIPPHKRNSNEADRPLPTPDQLAPFFKINVNVRSSKSNDKWTPKIIYADRAIRRWWVVGLNNDTQFPSSVNLEPISLKTVEQRVGESSLTLIVSGLDNGTEVEWALPKSPWVYMAENVLEDLLASFENVKKEMKSLELEYLKPTLVAQVGKVVHFHRTPSVTLESLRENLTTEKLKNLLSQSFYASVPVSYTEKIVNKVVPNIGVAFESEKEIYQVKLIDSTNPDSILSCKCSVKDGKLQLYKVELNEVRNMVVDISIPNKNMDLRLMLYTKRVLTSQTDEEMRSLRDVVDSAITDPGVKGGLRWPLEKRSSGKYNVVGVWHVRAKAYKTQSLRLRVMHADRFDFRTSKGQASSLTSLRLKTVVSELKEEKVDVSSVSAMLKENMKFIWDNFLSCESFSHECM